MIDLSNFYKIYNHEIKVYYLKNIEELLSKNIREVNRKLVKITSDEFYIFINQITIILIVTSQTYKFQQKLELRYFLKYLSENDFLGFFLQSLSLESDMF